MKILVWPVIFVFASRALAALALLASGLCPVTTALGQGSLTPPAAPGAMMKTLDQIEPRIDLFNAPASAVDTLQSDYHFHIVRSGAYYFSQNLSATKANGILVDAENVTIDFRGFLMQGSGGGDGIHNEQYGGLAVMNGAISGFANGINCLNNVAWAGQARNLTINSCTTNGMLLGDEWMVKDCTVYNGVGNSAIAGGNNCVFENASASKNTTKFGISGGNGCRFVNCTANNVTSSSASSSGINAGLAASVSHCTARSNGSGSTGAGITVGDGSNVSDCVSDSNHGSGIVGGGHCVITNCSGASNTGAGYSVGMGSVLTHCAAYSNHTGGIIAINATLVECIVMQNGVNLSSSVGIELDEGVGGVASPATGGIIDRCVVCSNNGDGIDVKASTVQVTGNSVGSNGGGGILVRGNNCRIVENQVFNEPVGIFVAAGDGGTATNNVIVKNTVAGSTEFNYHIIPGNRVGPIVGPPPSGTLDGSSAGAGMGTTDPWANFSY